MDSNDFEPFGKMLALTAEQYGKPLSPDLTRFYFEGLSHLSLDQVKLGLNLHLRNTEVGQFMPKIADILAAIEPDEDAEALEALRLLSRDNPITNQVIESMGGWRSWGMRDEQEWQRFGHAEFLRRYALYKKRERMDALPDSTKKLR